MPAWLAQQLYTFWDTGEERHLRRAVVADFRDRMPPPGRARGRAGVAAASRAFRLAIPDLRCEVHDLPEVVGQRPPRLPARVVGADGGRGGADADQAHARPILRLCRPRC